MSLPTPAERSLALAEQHVEAATYMTAEERFAEAHDQWHKAATLYEEAADPEGQRLAWQRAGLCSQKLGEPDRALDELARSVTLSRVPGAERSLAIVLSHIATLFAQRGDAIEAGESWNEALALATALHDHALVSAIAGNLGRLQMNRGAYDDAEAAFTRARDAAIQADDLAGLANADNALGEIARARGDQYAARTLFEKAFDAAHQARDTALMALTLNNLGNALRSLGDLERAESRFRAALAFANVLGDGPSIARTHTNLGNIAAARGDLDEAQRHYTQALSLDKRYKQHHAMLGGLVNLANLRATRGDFTGARKFYEEALDKLAPSSARTIADIETMLGQLEARLGHLDRAQQLFTQAQARATEAQHHAAIARLQMNLAAIDHARGHLTRALKGYRQAVGAIDQTGSPSDRVMAHLVVADAALATDQLDLAAAAVAQAQLRLDAMRILDEDGVPEDAPPLREALDLGAMHARVAHATAPSAATLTTMESAAEAFMNAGRTGDALGQWLSIFDDLPDRDDLVDRPDHVTRLDEGLTWARKQGLEPLALELESLHALATRAAPESLDPLHNRVTTLGLGLVALRVARRQVSLLIAHTRLDEAATLAEHTLSQAHELGAAAEAKRLEAARSHINLQQARTAT
jgi:tetratricopeptide (TPR) repeat protein